jgi:hypothetical protein
MLCVLFISNWVTNIFILVVNFEAIPACNVLDILFL